MRVDLGAPAVRAQVTEVRSAGGAVAALKEGAVVRGEVLSVKGDQAQIRLEGGAVLKAQVVSDAPLTQGERVTLMVSGKSGGQTLMQVIPDIVGGSAASPGQAIEAAGLPVDQRSLEAYAAFAKAGVRPSPEQLTAAVRTLAEFPDASPATAVFLALNNIDPTPAQMTALSALTEGPLVGEQLGRLMGELEQLKTAQVPPEQGAAAAQSGADVATLKAGAAAGAYDALRITLPAPSAESVAAFERAIAARSAPAAEAIAAEGLERKAASVVRLAVSLPEDQGEDIIRSFVGVNVLEDAAKPVVEAALLRMTRAMRGDNAFLPAQTGGVVIGEVVRHIQGVFAKAAEGRGFLPGEIARAAKEVQTGIDGAARALAMSREAPRAAALADKLSEQAKLPDSFERFHYMQIPLQNGPNRQTAELYIMKRNARGKKVDPENATMLIALDTQNMGRVESMIKVENKSVSLRFRLEKTGLVAYFKNHTVDMHESLAQEGYRLADVRCALIEAPVTPVTAEGELSAEFGDREGKFSVMV